MTARRVIWLAVGSLLASTALSGFAFAQDSAHVDWKDDGSVELILDPEYDEALSSDDRPLTSEEMIEEAKRRLDIDDD